MPLFFESYNTPVDGNGAPYPGAKLYFYDENTTTPKDTFTTRALSVVNANPVVADGTGRFAGIWLSIGRYKAVLKTSADVTIYTADGIEGTDSGFGILTTRGDLLTRSATGAIRLAIGANGTVLGSNGTDPGWVVAPALASTNVWTAANTFRLSDDGAGEGPTVTLDRLSTTPAASDVLAALTFVGRDSAGNVTIYAKDTAILGDATDGSEDGYRIFQTMQAGTLASRGYFGLGLVLGTATGGDQGDGKINAAGYYKNGVEILNSGVAAWVFSDSAGNIQSAYNVASIVVNATGNYTINFTTALVNGSYAVVGTGQDVNGVAQTTVAFRTGDLHSTTQLQIRTDRTGTPVSCNFSIAVLAG